MRVSNEVLLKEIEMLQEDAGLCKYTDRIKHPCKDMGGKIIVISHKDVTLTARLNHIAKGGDIVLEDIVTKFDRQPKTYTRYIQIAHPEEASIRVATDPEKTRWSADVQTLALESAFTYDDSLYAMLALPAPESAQKSKKHTLKTDDLPSALDYNHNLVNTDITPKQVVKKMKTALKKPDCPALTLLFHGQPGTSKTYTAKWIAEQLGMEVKSYLMGDLLRKYVGETEQEVKKLFEEAEQKGYIIHIDEIEGVSSDREKAEKSWQVSQTNAFLQGLDNYSGIFIATTNFTNKMDRAFLRRFLLKMQFSHLTEKQCKAAWRYFFKGYKYMSLEDGVFAPSDFAAVKRGFLFMEDDEITSDYIHKSLKEEASVRALGGINEEKNPIGFMT